MGKQLKRQIGRYLFSKGIYQIFNQPREDKVLENHGYYQTN